MTKKFRTRGRRGLFTIILAVMLVLGTIVNAAGNGWEDYDTSSPNDRGVYLKEEWSEGKQIIDYFTGEKIVRAGVAYGHTLSFDNSPKLYTLYDTNYWCFDKYGNIWAIDTSQNLLYCRAGSTDFVVNTKISGCTGFQRDEGKFGYLVYTNSGTYYFEELMRVNNNNYNNRYNENGYYDNHYYDYKNTNNYSDYDYNKYPYVKKTGYYYYYYTSANKYYTYYLSGDSLYYKGTNSSNYNTRLATSVKNITFYSDGYNSYIVYAVYGNNIYAYEIGETSSSYRRNMGSQFSYFDEYNYMSEGYYTPNGSYRNFSYSYDYDYNYNDSYYYGYPYVEKSGKYYYYYISSNTYYTYYLSGETLYYKGKNNSNSNTKLATDVSEVTFAEGDEYDGYIVYSTDNRYVYAYPVGKTSSSYKLTLGRNFQYFDETDYMSEGFYDRNDDFNWFDF